MFENRIFFMISVCRQLQGQAIDLWAGCDSTNVDGQMMFARQLVSRDTVLEGKIVIPRG